MPHPQWRLSDPGNIQRHIRDREEQMNPQNSEQILMEQVVL